MYHDAGADGNDPPAVRVRHDVAVTNRQKRHDDHPHRVEHALVLTIVVTTAIVHVLLPLRSLNGCFFSHRIDMKPLCHQKSAWEWK